MKMKQHKLRKAEDSLDKLGEIFGDTEDVIRDMVKVEDYEALRILPKRQVRKFNRLHDSAVLALMNLNTQIEDMDHWISFQLYHRKS